MTTTLTGIDVSFWQDDNATARQIDWGKAAEAGAVFAFIRAGQNTWYDADFGYNWAGAKAAGIKRGAYWYLDNRSGGEAQGQRFHDHVAATGDMGELPPVVDFEQRVTGLIPSEARTRLQRCLDKVEALDGRVPIIYTGPSYWVEYGSPEAKWRRYPLWIAHYTTAAVPTVPVPWPTWTVWQHTATGDGAAFGMESRGVDMDRYQVGQVFDDILLPHPPLTDAEKLARLWDAHPELH